MRREWYPMSVQLNEFTPANVALAMGEPAEVIYILMHHTIKQLRDEGAEPAFLAQLERTAGLLKDMFGAWDNTNNRGRWWRRRKQTPWSEFERRAKIYI